MFNLTAKIANQPIMDAPYLRHLRTADVFNEFHEARAEEAKLYAAVTAAIIAHSEAVKRKEAAKAKAEIMAHLEDLDNA
jgi:hypothetical protein